MTHPTAASCAAGGGALRAPPRLAGVLLLPESDTGSEAPDTGAPASVFASSCTAALGSAETAASAPARDARSAPSWCAAMLPSAAPLLPSVACCDSAALSASVWTVASADARSALCGDDSATKRWGTVCRMPAASAGCSCWHHIPRMYCCNTCRLRSCTQTGSRPSCNDLRLRSLLLVDTLIAAVGQQHNSCSQEFAPAAQGSCRCCLSQRCGPGTVAPTARVLPFAELRPAAHRTDLRAGSWQGG